MHDVVTALATQQAELTGLLESIDETAWTRPSRCEGWSVADVVLHLAQTNELALASARGELAPREQTVAPAGEIDAGADAQVAAERGVPVGDLLDRWRSGAVQLCDALRDCDPSARVTWVVGTLAVRTLASTRIAETWIHTGDVFHAFGGGPAPTDRIWHVARLAWRTLPYAFAQGGLELHGPVAFRLTAPSGAPWSFEPDGGALTIVDGPAVDLCMVAARRTDPRDTALRAEGPDAGGVLALVRTWA